MLFDNRESDPFLHRKTPTCMSCVYFTSILLIEWDWYVIDGIEMPSRAICKLKCPKIESSNPVLVVGYFCKWNCRQTIYNQQIHIVWFVRSTKSLRRILSNWSSQSSRKWWNMSFSNSKALPNFSEKLRPPEIQTHTHTSHIAHMI